MLHLSSTTAAPAVKPNARPRHHRSARCHFRNGICCAALRAIAAAAIYLQESLTLEQAAIRHGSGIAYVRAAVTLLKSENQSLIDQVLRGELSILVAAKQVEPLVRLLDAHRAATPANLDEFFFLTGCTADLAKHLVGSPPEERARAAHALGVDLTWDHMVDPLLR